jgi:hypothetical protein
MVMDVPKNCAECPFTDICLGPHYGGDERQYKEIRRGGDHNEFEKANLY